MNKIISGLINYYISKDYICSADIAEIINSTQILTGLKKIDYDNRVNIYKSHTDIETVTLQLSELLDIDISDNWESKFFGLFCPPQNVLQKKLNDMFQRAGLRKVVEFLYQLSLDYRYIRSERQRKNIVFEPYYNNDDGLNYIVTINLSKPEIVAGQKKEPIKKDNDEPKCKICFEKVGGFARENLRCFELKINMIDYFIQFPPYPYFDNHIVIVKRHHEPQVINKDTVIELLSLAKMMPGLKVASNTDRSGTGASNLKHRHYQAGTYQFPILYAQDYKTLKNNNLKISIIDFPIGIVKIKGNNIEEVYKETLKMYKKWMDYSDDDILIDKQTASFITHYQNGIFEMYMIPRNANQKLYLTDESRQNIKKEFVGIIEMCGYAILPGRLDKEFKSIENCIINNKPLPAEIKYHQNFYEKIKNYIDLNKCSFYDALKDVLGHEFIEIIKDNSPVDKDKLYKILK